MNIDLNETLKIIIAEIACVVKTRLYEHVMLFILTVENIKQLEKLKTLLQETINCSIAITLNQNTNKIHFNIKLS